MPLPHPVSPRRGRLAAAGVATATSVGLVLSMAAAPPAQAVDTTSPVIINEVFGGGGNGGAVYKQDFIELVNTGTTSVSLTGWYVWYASAAGTFPASPTATSRTPLTGSIAAGATYLIAESAGTGGTTDLPTPDVTGTMGLGGSAGKIALTNSDVTPSGSTAANVVDFVGYGGANDSAGGTPTGALSSTTSAQRKNDPVVNAGVNGTDFLVASPTPKAANTGGGDVPPSTSPTIQELQGTSFVSPLAGQAVTNVAGIVTAVKRGGSSQAFWIQQPTRDSSKPAASSGVQVFTGSTAPTVNVGDSVTVNGTVTEFYPGGAAAGSLSVTEITAPTTTLVAANQPVPAALALTAANVPSTYAATPVSGGNIETIPTVDPTRSVQEFYEAHEGEVASLSDVRVVGATTGFNEVYATVKPAEQATPRGGTYLPSYAAQPTGRIKIEPIGITLPAYNVGDQITGTTTGPIDWDNFGGYLIAATSVGTRTDNDLQPTVAAEQGTDEIAVATYNVENLDPTDPQSKFDRLASGIVDNLSSPDVVTLEEIQDDNGATNNGTVSADQTLTQLAAAVVAAGGPQYSFTSINPVDGQDGGEPGGNIRVAFFYNPERVSFTPRAANGNASTTAVTVSAGGDGTAVLSSNPGRIDPTNTAFANSRKPLAAEFVFNGKKVIVVANHLNSKGGDQSADGRLQPPTRSSEVQRTQQATVLNTFVKQVTAVDANANLVLAGDFNDYQFSGPITTLTDNGATLTDLISTLPVEQRYTYVFNGVSQVLDHIFVSPNLTSTAEYEVIHLNAEFADQASDHDPQVVRLPLAAAVPTTKKITLLNINDFHGRIDSNTVKFAGTVEQQRAAAGDGNTVFLSAGDNIGASLFASSSQQDNPTIDVLNALDLQASAVGNHEFDQGFSDLTGRVADRADWDYLGANVYLKGTTTPALPEYKVITVNGIRVGVIGAVTEETPSLVSPSGIANLDFGNPVEAVNRVAGQLTDGNEANGEADVLVAEYHAGAADSESDTVDLPTELAKGGEFADIVNNTSAAVAAIYNGHTHRTYTFDAPVPGVAGATRPVVQTGEYGSNIGNITLTVNTSDNSVASYTMALVPRTTVADTTLAATYPRVQAVKTIVDKALADAAVAGGVPVGSVSQDITRAFTPSGGENRGAESTLGNLVANALRDELSSSDRGSAQIGVVNPGGLRTDLRYANGGGPGDADGRITYAEANAVLPFGNRLFTLSLTGAQFKQVLEQQFQPTGSDRPFLNLGLSSNVSYTYDPTAATGSRITSVTVNGLPLGLTKSYRIGTFSFLSDGGDNFTAFRGATNVQDTTLVDRDAWVDYLSNNPDLTPSFSKRGVVVTGQPSAVGGGSTVKFGVSNLDLTSTGSPANTTVTATIDGVVLGRFPVTNGAASISVTIPSRISGAKTLVLSTVPTGTVVRIPLTVSKPGTLSSPRGTTFAAGDDITAAISGWPAGQPVNIAFNGKSKGAITPNSSGVGQLTFHLPVTQAAGTFTLVAISSVTGARSAPISIKVVAKPFQAGNLSANKTLVPQSGKVVLTLSEWTPNTLASITLDGTTPLGSVTTSATGTATITVKIGGTVSLGTHRLVATAADGSLVSVNISVTAKATTTD